jgi:hypothetical protein
MLLHFQRSLPEGLFSTNFGGRTVRQNGFSNGADPLGVSAFVTQHKIASFFMGQFLTASMSLFKL